MLSLLTPTRPIRPAQRSAPALAAAHLAQPGYGVADRDAPTVDQQRASYRGLVATLARLRASAVAAAMQDAEAVREVAPREVEPVEPGEPWARLLRQPHPTYSPLWLWSWAQQAKDLGRGAFLVVGRDARGVPVALYPVHPALGTMNPVGGPAGEVAGYVFVRSDGARAAYAARDVVWVRHPHPVSPYESASLLEVSAYEADTDLYAHVYRRDLMRRGGAPKLQLTTDQVIDQATANEAEDRATRKILGRADRVPVFGKGMELKPVGLSAQDMEYVKAAELTRTELYEIWGVPQGLRDMDATRANAEQAARSFAQWTVQPEADAMADQLTTQLRLAFAPEGGPPVTTLAVRAPDVVPLDPEFLLKRDEAFLRTGRVTPNELREADGRDGFGPDGDAPMVSGALVPLSSLHGPPPGRPPSPPAPEPGDGPDAAEGDSESDEDDESSRAARSSALAGRLRSDLRVFGALRARGVRLTDDDLDREWRAVDGAKREAERPVEAAALAYFRAMRADVVGNLRDQRSGAQRGASALRQTRRTPEEAQAEAASLATLVFDLDVWAARVAADLGPAFLAALRAGFESGALRLDADLAFDPSRPVVRQALARIVSLAESVPETAKDRVERALAEGLAAGEDAAALAARVGDLFDDMAPERARLIAQTSGTQAFEAGQVESYREAGADEKMWLSQRDDRVRPAHAEIDGERVPVDEPFSNGLQHPGEPNCRCSTLPIVRAEGDAPRTWTQRRNAHIRDLYRATAGEGSQEQRAQRLWEGGAFEGEAFDGMLAFSTFFRICREGGG